MKRNKPLITISIPVLNEEKNIKKLYNRLVDLADKMHDRCNLEFLFSDNHSSDNTWLIILGLSKKDSRVKAIRFSQNVGFQRSILANYIHAQGDAIMQVDADLQDPPELLEQFFEKWIKGSQVVYGIRKKRPEHFLLHKFRKLGYWLIDKISDYPIPKDAGDFRLIDKKVANVLIKMKTANPYLRGMIAGLGFKQTGISYDREARVDGKSKFSLLNISKLGLTAVFNHSTVPLRAVSFLGIIILLISIAGALYYLVAKILHPELPQGLASIHILVLFGIGLNALLLGILGEYLLRIYLIIRADPIAIVEQSTNFSDNQLKL